MLLGLALSSGVFAAACLTIWAIGRPADGHPLCRRCGFDLVGTPKALPCPECGADLSRRRAVRMNARRRSRLLLVIGLLCLIIAGGAAFPVVRSQLAAVAYRDRPNWWLVRDTRSQDPSVVGPVLRELLARYEAGTLSNSAVRSLAAQGLAYRDSGAPCGMWNCEYGNFLDIAWQNGLLSQGQMDSYIRGAVGLWWSGPSLRTFEDAPSNPMLVVIATSFLGNPFRSTAAPAPVDFELLEVSASLGGEPAEVQLKQRPGGFDPASSLYRVSLASAIVELPMQPEGIEVELRWCVQLVDMRTRAPVGEPWTGSRTFTIDGTVRGGARPQDDRQPPDISRY